VGVLIHLFYRKGQCVQPSVAVQRIVGIHNGLVASRFCDIPDPFELTGASGIVHIEDTGRSAVPLQQGLDLERICIPHAARRERAPSLHGHVRRDDHPLGDTSELRRRGG
jgi:hypothetical protein